MIETDNEKKIRDLQAHIAELKGDIEHLRKKAEFNMPVDMHRRFHNACTDPCDMIDGPCACGAWHSAKEWIEKLNGYLIDKDIEIKMLREE